MKAQTLVAGEAAGPTLVLDQPLSLWGGIEPVSGAVSDRLHPQLGECVTGRVLVMPGGRGSSSSSTILAELVRLGTAPAAIVLRDPDHILVAGALVARELYGRAIPIVVLPEPGYSSVRTGDQIALETDGTLTTSSPSPQSA